jgi:hypothetical protein
MNQSSSEVGKSDHSVRHRRDEEAVPIGTVEENDPDRSLHEGRRRTARASVEQWYCYDCGTPWKTFSSVPTRPGFGTISLGIEPARSRPISACVACGGKRAEPDLARPTIDVPNDVIRFDFPWDLLPWPTQGTVVVEGGPGSGKSSLADLLEPELYMSREMEPKVVGAVGRRIKPRHEGILVKMVKNAEMIERILADTKKGPVVMDSLTALPSMKEALIAAHLVNTWAKKHNERALAIVQVNKSGEGAGFMQIPHLFDTVVELAPDPWGMRIFRVTKSRWCSVASRYWTFNDKGKIGRPSFDAAYSVEGSPGEYWLHPYPMPGAKWAGLLQFLDKAEALTAPDNGVACAALTAKYMKNGFVEPPDKAERKNFAIDNGLFWIDPTSISGLLKSIRQEPDNDVP